jgi:DNA polymerase III alpha subunit
MTVELPPEFPHRTRKKERPSPSPLRRTTAPFVELHCHSAYSFLDGASLPEELAVRAAELGYEALALTDHDGLYGSLEFAHAAKHFGIRPITGAELTLADRSHVTLLVETPRGYANLCRLITAAHADTRPLGRETQAAAKRPVRASGPGEGVWGNREVPPDG